MDTEIGEKYIEFLSKRNYEELEKLFHPDVTARLLIPAGLLTVYTSENLLKKIDSWFCDSDYLELVESSFGNLGGKISINYKFKCRENNELYLVEQQIYSRISGGKIILFDLLCSGFQKLNS